ncbi:MAG: hypothetical protein HKN23_14240 [Verrucomicrobiales bacterium]|nr:hypothetical protein [Verrucomicrobiales bacterium]
MNEFAQIWGGLPRLQLNPVVQFAISREVKLWMFARIDTENLRAWISQLYELEWVAFYFIVLALDLRIRGAL